MRVKKWNLGVLGWTPGKQVLRPRSFYRKLFGALSQNVDLLGKGRKQDWTESNTGLRHSLSWASLEFWSRDNRSLCCVVSLWSSTCQVVVGFGCFCSGKWAWLSWGLSSQLRIVSEKAYHWAMWGSNWGNVTPLWGEEWKVPPGRSLADYSPWGRRVDLTEQLST